MKDWPTQDDEPDWKIRLEFWFIAALAAVSLSVIVFSVITPRPAAAHPGRTAADGCHNDRKNGGRHCHGGSKTTPKPPVRTQRASGRVHFANCTEARAAGAAPVRRGDPGYASHLDRDNDGIGCE